MVVLIQKLVWNEWNIAHIARHGVLQTEVETSLQDEHVVFMQGYSQRVIVLGRVGNRLLTTVLQAQKNQYEFYVVTARDMPKKERAIYRQEKIRKESK
ncbi:MAG: hypothetical protein O2840_04270 [bacterium]|nr:hypothetical protein [bacterium]